MAAALVLLGATLWTEEASAQYVDDYRASQPRPYRGAPRVVYDWDPDVPPPDGYELDWDMNGAMLGVGIGLFASGYLTSVLVGAVANATTSGGEFVPLFVPVGGPFVAISTLDPSPGGLGLLIANGVVQSGGLLGIALAFVDTRHKIIRTGGVEMEVTPMIGEQQQGLSLRGSF